MQGRSGEGALRRRARLVAMLRRAFHSIAATCAAAPRRGATPPASVAPWTRALTTTTTSRPSSDSTTGSFSGAFVAARPGTIFAPPSRGALPEDDARAPASPFALMAVPKRKVSPSRKGKRNQFRRIKFVGQAVRCRDCGKVKMPHVYCDRCSANVYEEEDLDGGGVPRAGVTQP